METPAKAPQVTGLLEAALYVDDLERSAKFYREVLGFPLLAEFREGDRGFALRVAERQVLLAFRKRGSVNHVPPHDGDGNLHVAFAVTPAQLLEWERHLARHAVAIEHRITWPKGGTSIYFRDPDGHLLELATPGVWENY